MSELDTRALPAAAPAGLRVELALATLAQRAGAIVSLLALVVAWEIAARSGIVTPFLLPPLSAVLARVGDDAMSGELTVNLGLTLYRALVGFAIAGSMGIILGILMTQRPLIRWFFDPIVSVGFPMPKIAFLPIFMLWLGLYDTSKISMAAFNASRLVWSETWLTVLVTSPMLAVHGRAASRAASPAPAAASPKLRGPARGLR